ncbi:MAG: phosphatase PAP2 family protein [Patescibacteria group bacterium]|nr:MAG: phosphatase PAP2 family protein [Patescibacteria group bacterium]
MWFSNLINLDNTFSADIQNVFSGSSFFYYLFVVLTNPYFIVLLFYVISLFLLSSKQIIKKTVFFFLIGLTSFLLSDYVIKTIFKVSRPELNQFCPSNYSFPSSHSVVAFAYAAFLGLINKHFVLLLFFLAGLIGVSRIYHGCHYLSDVLFGAFIGMFLAWIFYWLYKIIFKE